MSKRTLALVALGGATAGIGFRIWAVLSPQGALDADEAVVGLLSRGILHGTLPVFFPGQGYGGTQEAFLAAPLVGAFGLHALAIRIVVILLWAASAVLVWRIGVRVLDEQRAVLAAVLFWIWPAYFDWKSTRAHGFYGSELFLALAALLLVLRLAERVTRRDLVLLGLALGCGLWSSPQIAIVALPALGWLLWIRREVVRGLPYVLPAGVIGGLPWLLGNVRHDWYSLHPGANEGPWSAHLHNLVVATLPEASACASRGRSNGSAPQSRAMSSTPSWQPAWRGSSFAGPRGSRRCCSSSACSRSSTSCRRTRGSSRSRAT